MKIIILFLALFIPVHMTPAMIPNDKKIVLPAPTHIENSDYEEKYWESDEDPDPIQGIDAGIDDDDGEIDGFNEGLMVSWIVLVFLSAGILLAYMARNKD